LLELAQDTKPNGTGRKQTTNASSPNGPSKLEDPICRPSFENGIVLERRSKGGEAEMKKPKILVVRETARSASHELRAL
jgi:hypothetical protein